MAKKHLPCPTLVRQLLIYDPETGKLFWKERPEWLVKSDRQSTRQRIARNWNARHVGVEAFTTVCRKRGGHLIGTISCVHFYAHRVIWAIVYGRWPDGEIDHINGNPSDNRITNLRIVTSAENSQNTSIYRNNKTGHHGIWWDEKRRKYQAYITINGVRKSLGRYTDIDEAIKRRCLAEIAMGFHANHGRPKTNA